LYFELGPVSTTLVDDYKCAQGFYITSMDVRAGAWVDSVRSFQCSDGSTVSVRFNGSGGDQYTPTSDSGFCSATAMNDVTTYGGRAVASQLSFYTCDTNVQTSPLYGNGYRPTSGARGVCPPSYKVTGY
jgi:hypothetical protein